MATIKRVNHRHEGIVNWLVMNPEKSLGDCAQHFRYTQAWLTAIVHSDAFQAKYQTRCREVGELAVHTTANKLNGLAALCIDKAADRIAANAATERFLGETMKETLKALGYGGLESQTVEIHKHDHLHVDSELLRQARERALQPKNGSTAAKVVEAVPLVPDVHNPTPSVVLVPVAEENAA